MSEQLVKALEIALQFQDFCPAAECGAYIGSWEPHWAHLHIPDCPMRAAHRAARAEPAALSRAPVNIPPEALQDQAERDDEAERLLERWVAVNEALMAVEDQVRKHGSSPSLKAAIANRHDDCRATGHAIRKHVAARRAARGEG